MSVATRDMTEWVRNERRKQNSVLLFVALACLLIAFFPRNERRLFIFDGVSGLFETISAPIQTNMRSSIFDGLEQWGTDRSEEPSGRQRHERVLPVSADELAPLDAWDGFDFQPEPITFDNLNGLPAMPDLGPAPVRTPTRQVIDYQFRHNDHGGHNVFFAAVPEVSVWAMLIAGFGAIAWRLRAAKLAARKRRARARWRRNLVPVPR